MAKLNLETGGEMGELIDAFAWQNTPVGEKNSWSASLRSQVNLMLYSRFPMLIFWGPELTTFYNDAFRPSLGENGKHPASLGQPGHISWSESWPTIGPMIQNIIQGGEAVWFEDQKLPLYRDGVLTYAYWTYSFSPLIDDDEQIMGVLVTCSETTKAVENLQRLTESEARLESSQQDLLASIAAIQESEQKFKTLIGVAPVGIAMFVGPEHRIELANATILAQWRKSGDIIGKTVLTALPEIADQRFPKLLEKVYRTGLPHRESAVAARLMVDRQLSTFYFDISYTPLLDQDGKSYAILDILIDVTQTVLARRELQQSERFSRTIFYNSPVAKIVYSGRNMIVQQVNEKMLEILNQDSLLLGKPLLEVIPSLANTGMVKAYQKVLLTGEPEEAFSELIEIEGKGHFEVGYYDYTFKPLFDEAGQITGVMSTVIDVTEKVKTLQQLAESEALLRGAVSLAGLGTWSLEAGSSQIFLSAPMSDWFGSKPGHLNLERAFNQIIPQDRERVVAAVNEALDPASSGSFDQIYSLTDMVTGLIRIVHSQGKVVKDANGTLLRLNGTAQDITMQREQQIALEHEVALRTTELAASNEELLAINEELEEANSQLFQSNEELSQYAYVASHDLQEPLRKIRIYSGIIASKSDLSDESRLVVDKIGRSAERMSHLIRDLLAFSRLLRAEFVFDDVDVEAIIQSVWDDFELTIADTGASIDFGPLPVIQGIRLQINQLFYNLIGNALKFIRPGTRPWISVNASIADPVLVKKYVPHPVSKTEYVLFTVQDNGIGFNQEYADQIFEVFKRLHTREVFSGSGIGLALCRRIATNHQGALYATSVPDEGSCFYILLPKAQSAL